MITLIRVFGGYEMARFKCFTMPALWRWAKNLALNLCKGPTAQHKKQSMRNSIIPKISLFNIINVVS